MEVSVHPCPLLVMYYRISVTGNRNTGGGYKSSFCSLEYQEYFLGLLSHTLS